MSLVAPFSVCVCIAVTEVDINVYQTAMTNDQDCCHRYCQFLATLSQNSKNAT